MKKHPLKRIVAVVLAMTIVLASLPLLAGRLITAIAGTSVNTFADLKDRLADGTTEIDLNGNITLEAAITIPNTCTKISGAGHTINTAGFTISTDSSTNVILENVNIKGGTAGVISNVAGSKMVIRNSNIRENILSTGNLIDNAGTMVLDGVGVNENKIRSAAINNSTSGILYTNNVTVAGNVSSTDANALFNAGSAYILNTTISGNKARGIYSQGDALKMVNDLIEKNIPNGSNESDIVAASNTTNNLLAYSVYGTVNANTLITDNSRQVADSKDIFCDYSASDNFPLVYNNVLYLNSAFSAGGATTYFDYNADLSNVGVAYDNAASVRENVIGTATTEVTKFQIGGTPRGITIGSAPSSADTYHKVTLETPAGGSVDGVGLLFGTVVKDGDDLDLSANANSGYTFRRFINVTTGASLSTSLTYTFTPTADTVIKAEFSQSISPYSLSLLLDGVAWPGQTVELYQYGQNQNVTFTYTGNKYTGTVYSGKYDVYVNGSDSNQDVTVAAGTTSGTVKYSSIEYLANGGTGNPPAKVCVPTNSTVQLDGKGTLSKEDYNFTGWVKQGETTVRAEGSSFNVTTGTKLYANWLSEFVTAKAVIKLNGTPSNGFTVKFKNKSSGTEYAAAYVDDAYSVSVPNSTTDMYDVIVDGRVIDTMTCTGLNNLVYNYYTVTYHGNGNTNTAQGNVIKKALAGASYTLEPNVYVKAGYTFAGWNLYANGGGTNRDAGYVDRINAATDYYAQWTVGNYTVTFNVDGGSALSAADSSKSVAYGSQYGTLPTTTKAGYTFGGWYNGSNQVTATTIMNIASNHTLKAKWIPVKYAITPPANSADFFTFNGNTTADHGANYTFTLTPKTGYSVANAVVKVKDTSDGSNEQTLASVAGVYTIPSVTCAKTITVTGVIDTLPPTGEISISTNKWTSLLNTITFGKFFKDTQTVKITATDPSGVRSIGYHVATAKLSLNNLDNLAASQWTSVSGGGTFTISPDKDLIVYAKLVDNGGYTAYISSDGVVLDKTAPVISGVIDGETYTGTQTVTITDAHLASVLVDDVSVIPDASNQITVAGKDESQTIVATDKCGNTTTVSITVNRDPSVPDGEVTKELEVALEAPETELLQTKEELADMILTDDDLEDVDCGEDINILVEVKGEDVVPDEDKELIDTEMTDKEIISIFDISVFKEFLTTGDIERITATPSDLTFIFTIPDEYLDVPEGKVRTFYLGRVHDDAFSYLDDTDSEFDTYTADTDKFSTYVLAYKDAEGTGGTPGAATSDTTATTTPTTTAIGDTTTVAGDTSTTTVAPSDSESTTAETTDEGSGGILTRDNAPVLVTVIAVMAAGTATLLTDKKRRQAKKENKIK